MAKKTDRRQSRPSPDTFLSGVATVPAMLDKMNMSELLHDLSVEELSRTRFLLAVGIRDDGSCYFYSRGRASSLEISGLRVELDSIMDAVDESMEPPCGCPDSSEGNEEVES